MSGGSASERSDGISPRQPVGILSYRPQTATLVPSLQQLGLGKLGALVRLTAAEIADRFGEPGTIARRLALGYDTPLRVRRSKIG